MTAMVTMSTMSTVTEHVHRNEGDEDQCRKRICRNPFHDVPASSKVAYTKLGCPRIGQGEFRSFFVAKSSTVDRAARAR
jgi:hypothetical protein